MIGNRMDKSNLSIEIFNKKRNIHFSLPENDSLFLFKQVFGLNPFVVIDIHNRNHHSVQNSLSSLFLYEEDLDSDSLFWFLKLGEQCFRIDMSSYDSYPNTTIVEDGIRLKLILKMSKIPVEKSELEKLKNKSVNEENYEFSSLLRDLILIEFK
ncbi:hypothetical protein N9P66_01260 [Salibacteraceae bacterium]|nr:hypothetical protein [Salibacteraceae bacterium]